MMHYLLISFILLSFTACGSNEEDTPQTLPTPTVKPNPLPFGATATPMPTQPLVEITPIPSLDPIQPTVVPTVTPTQPVTTQPSATSSPTPSPSPSPSPTPSPTPTPEPIVERPLTILVHGFNRDGYKREGVYGDIEPIDANKELASIVGFSTDYQGDQSNFDENIVISTTYYGKQAPAYYTQSDIDEVENTPNGIPRYALRVAKFAKEKMQESNATKVNFFSGSMGSLVTRYIIEKDIENLASQNKIAKWFSAEGVVGGNYITSESWLMFASGLFDLDAPEVDHMDYDWINRAFGNRKVGSSPYYKNILIGFESSTKEDDLDSVLTNYLSLKGKYYPNDGYQLVKDTYFRIDNLESAYQGFQPTQSYFHETHTSLNDNIAAWNQLSLFFTSQKRVKISLTQVQVDDRNEEDNSAEIVFSSQIFSPHLYEIANITQAIDRRDISSGILPIVYYSSNGETQVINQSLFDAFVSPDESELLLKLEGYEIDDSWRYDIDEHGDNKIDSIGSGELNIPLKEGLYEIVGSNWLGEVKVEIIDYE